MPEEQIRRYIKDHPTQTLDEIIMLHQAIQTTDCIGVYKKREYVEDYIVSNWALG